VGAGQHVRGEPEERALGSAMPPLGLQNVTLSCTDGTLLNLELDATALTALADAVAAINLYPAGDPRSPVV